MKQSENKSTYSEIYKILDNRNFTKEINTVYHYTTLETLHKILSTKSFHFSHCSFMNDYSEFDFGINSFQEMMKEYVQTDEGFSAINALDLLKSIKKTNNVFIGSFTHLKDSLSQWRAYASNATGVGIGMNTKKIDQYCLKHDLLFGSVVYEDNFKQVFVNFFRSMLPTIKHVLENESEEKIKGFNTIVFGYLLVLTCFIKHLGFKEEGEIRIVVGSGQEIINKFHRGLYLPYVELNFEGNLLEMIDEIWIGPAANQELTKRSVGLMLKEYRIENKCDIKLSQIPFRLIEQ